jgi:septation ring formation regulator EzrA
MEILPLVVEGIENKIKKLFLINQHLQNENQQLRKEKSELTDLLEQSGEKVKQLEEQINRLKVAKILSGKDHLQARQQINELLREIEKCYALLNR